MEGALKTNTVYQKRTIRKRSGFTLLEVLIAVGVLFIIGSAVVSLSNTLIQGTVKTADATITNLWAVEGLELLSKIRDDNYKNPAREASGESTPWIDPAKDSSFYGWHALRPQADGTWKLEKLTGIPNNVSIRALYDAPVLEQKTSEGLVAKRVICIESVAAESPEITDNLRCNTNQNGVVVSDGARNRLSSCSTEDLYCRMTQASLNRNSTGTTIIPAGNALKVRAVLVWPNNDGFRSSSMGMFLTNWRSYDQ